MEQLRQQVAALNRKLNAMSINGTPPQTGKTARNRRRRQRQRQRGAGQTTPGTTGLVTNVAMNGGGRGRRNRGRGPKLAQGEIAMAREELIRTISIPAGKTKMSDYVDLCPENFAFLKTLYNSFERIKYLKLNIRYKSAVGTMQGGMVTYAIDWSLSASGKDRTALSSYTPNCSHPVWQTSNGLTLPVSRLQSRTWYVSNSSADAIDKCPARLLVAADATAGQTDLTVGELWVDYHVVLSGTKA